MITAAPRHCAFHHHGGSGLSVFFIDHLASHSLVENNVEDKEMEEGEVPKTPTTPTKTPPKLASKKVKTDAKPAEDGKAAKVKLKK